MTEIGIEISERLLLLSGLLEFNRKEESFQHMERVLKLEEPDFKDIYTIKSFEFIETRNIEDKTGYVFQYDSRNVDMARLVGKDVCWKNPNYESPISENDSKGSFDGGRDDENEQGEPFIKKSLKIYSVNHGKQEFVIVKGAEVMEAELSLLTDVDALTEFTIFRKNDHQASVERIVNAYLNSIGIAGEDDYLNALIANSEEGSERPQNVVDHNELAFSVIEKSSLIQETNGDFEEIVKRIRGLKSSYIAIQGPPGTGKTYNGAHIVHNLLSEAQGNALKIGITAQSNSAIDNLLMKVIGVFEENKDLSLLRAYKKKGDKNHPEVDRLLLDKDYDALRWNAPRKRDANLVAATSWGFVKMPEDEEKFDYLIIDEAGQFSLFDTISCCASAKNIIFLGDPQQLPQVTQASHHFGAGQSALEYLIGEKNVIDSDKGILLQTTYRLRPEICTYISSEFYEDELNSEKRCKEREIDGERNGLFWIDAKHIEECVNQSREEAAIVKQVVTSLIGEKIYKYDEKTNGRVGENLQEDDFVIVTPYNAQRLLILDALRDQFPEIKVGTVDDFQGREAPVVIYSMATTSGDLVPPGRGDFIYKPNRLNVALSRAQCLSIVVANRELVEAHASSIPEMKDMNHLCRIFEDEEIANEWAI
jgi:uncharacterized protein